MSLYKWSFIIAVPCHLSEEAIFARDLCKQLKTTLWLHVLRNDLLTSLKSLETIFGKFSKRVHGNVSVQAYKRRKNQIYFFCTRKNDVKKIIINSKDIIVATAQQIAAVQSIK